MSTTGAFVDAVMFSPGGLGGVANTTINGVTFTDVNTFINSSSGAFSWTFINAGNDFAPLAAPFANLPAAYQAMVRTTTNTDFTLTIGGLTAGATYAFQWWANLSGTAFGQGSTTALAGNSVTLDNNTTDVDGGLGQFVLGSFVADGATQQVQFTGVGTQARVNGLQLRLLAPASVPEPGTALAGMVLVGLCGTMRRRR